MEQRRGCLGGLLQLAFLAATLDWLERRFGFGRGCSCSGMGCGLILLLLFLLLVCGTCSGTDWFHLSF
jgi:hypothetical protein